MKAVTVVPIEDSHADFILVSIQTSLKLLLNNGYAVKLIGGGLQKNARRYFGASSLYRI